jgi:hypothetical protein
MGWRHEVGTNEYRRTGLLHPSRINCQRVPARGCWTTFCFVAKGYQWYVDPKELEEGLPLHDLEGTVAAYGRKGQHIVVLPRSNIVIALICPITLRNWSFYNREFLTSTAQNLPLLEEELTNSLLECAEFSLLRFASLGP